ncbi:MAG: hypothetical protein ACQEXJ_25065 [Myxococcota bacterium]
MSRSLDRYRELEDELVYIRWLHQGLESDEEDELLDEMDAVWRDLTAQERALVDAEPPRSLVRSPGAPGTARLVDTDKLADPAAPPRRRAKAA